MEKNICFSRPKVLNLVLLFLIVLLINGSTLYSTNNKTIDNLIIKYKSEKTILKKIKTINSILWESRYLHPEIGIEYGKKALLLEVEYNIKKEKAQTLSLMGVCHTSLKNYNMALQYFTRAQKLAEEINSPYHLAHSYNNVSNIYQILGQYDKAYAHLFKALKLFSKTGNKAGIAYSLVSLGDLELILKKHEKALEYFDKAFKVREEMGDILEQHRILLRKADVSYKKKKYRHSLEQYKNLKIDLEKPNLKYRDTSAIKYHYAVALSGIAANYYMLKEYPNALKFNRDALDINLKIKASTNTAKNYNAMGKIYTKLSDYVKAFEYINKGMSLAISYKLKEQELSCLKSLIELHKIKLEFEMAYIQYEKMTEIKETLYNEKKNNQIEILRAEYGLQNKENEIVLLKNKTKLKNLEKNSLIVVLVMSFILLIVITIRFYHKSKINKILNQQKTKLENAYTDLQEMSKWAVELERKNIAMAMAITANHEIIQPLTVLQGNFELLTNILNLDSFSDKERSYILKIDKSITRITKILNKYKDVDDFTIEKYDQNKNMIVYKEDLLKEKP